MNELIAYIENGLGLPVTVDKAPKESLGKLPFYIRNAFRFTNATLMNHPVVFLHLTDPDEPAAGQVERQLETIREKLHKIPVLIADDISAITRRRLIEKRVNFIVPGKQLFLPALLLDFTEQFRKVKDQTKTLTPSAQVILLYHILKRFEKLAELPLKDIARKLKYTGAGITKAAENLRLHNLCQIKGSKEKYIHFSMPIPELWGTALPLLTTPVIKRVYVDKLPATAYFMNSNTSALPEYSEMVESRQQFLAIDKRVYYNIERKNELVNPNPYDGRYCLEVWKYNPAILAEEVTENSNVDPLSLYLTLKDHNDERIQMAMEKIISYFIW